MRPDILTKMQLFGANQGKSVVIQAFQEDVQKKYALPPKKCITRTSLYTVLDIKFFRIPVNHQENGCDKWVQTRGYRACVFNMPIPLRVCLTGVPT